MLQRVSKLIKITNGETMCSMFHEIMQARYQVHSGAGGKKQTLFLTLKSKNSSLDISLNQKPSHMDQYLHFKSHHLIKVNRSIVDKVHVSIAGPEGLSSHTHTAARRQPEYHCDQNAGLAQAVMPVGLCQLCLLIYID